LLTNRGLIYLLTYLQTNKRTKKTDTDDQQQYLTDERLRGFTTRRYINPLYLYLTSPSVTGVKEKFTAESASE